MKIIINFKDAFVKNITRMVKPYDEERIIFDCYDMAILGNAVLEEYKGAKK